MADDLNAQPGQVNPNLPSDSQTENQNNGGGDNDQTTPAGAQNSDDQVPYNENPKIQEYINRQVETRVEHGVNSKLATMGLNISRQNGQEKSVLDQIAGELTEEYQLHPEKAKSLAQKMRRAASQDVEPLKTKVEEMELTMRFGSVYSKNPDAGQYQKVMTQIFGQMNEVERNFVLRSPNGAQYLYEEAKKRFPVPGSSDFAKGGSSHSKGIPPQQKGGVGQQTHLDGALKAFQSGDKTEYENRMRLIQNAK